MLVFSGNASDVGHIHNAVIYVWKNFPETRQKYDRKLTNHYWL